MNRAIKSIIVEGQGYIYSKENEPIEVFHENGEMALVKWYRKGNREFNGKYVIQIEYEDLSLEEKLPELEEK